MYSDKDLDAAVAQGIFSDDAVRQFRALLTSQKIASEQNNADEETFRFIKSFNDIFVVIAALLLIFSLAALAFAFDEALAPIAAALTSWLLSDFFVRKRRMALPAIVLLFVFLLAVCAFPFALSTHLPNSTTFINASLLTSLAAWLHWRRFQVPITIAMAALFIVVTCIAFLVSFFSSVILLPLVFISGMIIFAIAMAWDISDTSRQSNNTDVAFWLHLAASPLIVHPIFFALGILDGQTAVSSAIIITIIYLCFTIIALAIDRRAIMVSSLAYVLYACTALLETFGMISLSFTLIGIFFGASLLLLSAFWQPSRAHILQYLPERISKHLPPVQP